MAPEHGEDSDASREGSPANLFEDNTVEIVIGQTQKAYHVHENLLHAHSGFLSAALEKDLLDGRVTLPDEDAGNFYRYIQYLYTKNVPHDDDDDEGDDFVLLAERYTLGERMLNDKYKDNVLNAIVSEVWDSLGDLRKGWPCIQAVNVIYQGTPPTSPARRCFIDLYVAVSGIGLSYTYRNGQGEKIHAHTDFMLAVLEGMSEERELDLGWQEELRKEVLSRPACAYHHHAEGAACRARSIQS